MTTEIKDDVVLVEHTDAQATNTAAAAVVSDDDGDVEVIKKDLPTPLQIVSIGTEEDQYAFTFHEEELNKVISRIPPGWKVAVVSVVGAFRTGKSFLLSWFLRYLYHLTKSKEEIDESKKWYDTIEKLGNKDGFDWRGGHDRNTTGIWMWSEPHYVKIPSSSGGVETMAVLLVDSQGMFDNETTMSLTASIFGLSTLLSSYQIYNVDKRIQEDNLQQLALFSEYARLAVEADNVNKSHDENIKPFQRMEFLVRDWQHFEEEEDYDQMVKEMEAYVDKVISERDAKDLQETREQIVACFENISCFGLCHPGMAVIKKSFEGDVNRMEPDFLELLDRYCQRVFSVDNLEPKSIQGRHVTAAELGSYIKAYAEMFASGASFPEASTMLEATASANNTNAVNMAIHHYKDTMDRIAGPRCSNFVRPGELKDDHKRMMARALESFDSMATFGSQKNILSKRQTVVQEIQDEFERYSSLNDGRNPLAGLQTWGLPLAFGLVAYIFRGILDATCAPYSSVCKRGSEFSSHVFAVVLCFLLIILVTKAKQVQELFVRAKSAFELIAEGKVKKD